MVLNCWCLSFARRGQSDIIGCPTPLPVISPRWSSAQPLCVSQRKLLDFSEHLSDFWTWLHFFCPSPPLPKLAKLICILFDGWMLQETCSTGTWLQFQTGVTLVALLLLSLGFDLLRKGLVCVLLHYQVCVRVCVQRSTAVYINIKETI